MRLLHPHDVAYMRTTTVALSTSDRGVERKTATGRATCRSCGRKIEKGVVEIVAFYAFDDHVFGGSPTSTTVHIHADSCTH